VALLTSTSELLQGLLDDGNRSERISIGTIVEGGGGRAHGIVLLILSLPETIPMIGLSAILAVPILVLGFVMIVRGADPPVPERLRERTLPWEKVESAIRRTLPAIRWLERFSRPRWERLAAAGRLQGGVCIVMSVILAIPIPGINMVAALAVAGVGLGILQRDGVAVAAAAVFAAIAVTGFVLVVTGAWAVVATGVSG
jgi:hypothetical protein